MEKQIQDIKKEIDEIKKCYVSKSELPERLRQHSELNNVSRVEFMTLSGKVDGLTALLEKNSTISDEILSSLSDLKTESSNTANVLESVKKELEEVKRGSVRSFLAKNDFVSFSIRFVGISLVIFMLLFVYTTIFPKEVENLVMKNGGIVSLITIALSTVGAWFGKER